MKFLATSALIGLVAGRSMYSLNEGDHKNHQEDQMDFSNWDMDMFNMGNMGGGIADMHEIPGFDQWKANKEYYMNQMGGGSAHMTNWMEQFETQNIMDWMEPKAEKEGNKDKHDRHEKPHKDHYVRPDKDQHKRPDDHDDHHERPHDDHHERPNDDHHEQSHDDHREKPHDDKPNKKPDHRPNNKPDGHHPNEDDCEEWESDDEDDEGDNVIITHIDNRFLYVAPIVNRNNIVISNVNHDNTMIDNKNAMVNLDAQLMKKMMWMKKMKHMSQMKEEGKISEEKMHHFLEHAKEYLSHQEMEECMDNMDEHHYDEDEHSDHYNETDEEDSEDDEFSEFEEDPFFDEDFFEINW